ncbi:MAG: hypothetical protein ACYCU7_19320, partial [Acidimicrobiales bacterium]
MTHYKATRPDGGSFGAPELTWRIGRITRLPAGETPGNELCKPGLLHAATEAGEALVSYTDAVLWPCRLFAVEPRAKL